MPPMLHMPYTQSRYFGHLIIYARTAGNPERLMAAIGDTARGLDPSVPVFDVRTVAEQVDRTLTQEKLVATLGAFFGFLALALSAVGIYGVMAYAVSRRTKEIGIRMALGAERWSIIVQVVREAAFLVLAGALIGLPLALAGTKLIASLLYGIGPNDAASTAIAIVVLTVVAIAAVCVPARRASRVDPMTALRYE